MVDPLSVSALAATVVSSFLLPFVKRGAEALTEALASKTADAAAEHAAGVAGRIWNRVRQAFTGKEEQTLALFEQHPEQMEKVLTAELERKLEQDPELLGELSDLVRTPGPSGQPPGVVIQNAGLAGVVTVQNARFEHVGRVDIIGVRGGGPVEPPPPPQPPSPPPQEGAAP